MRIARDLWVWALAGAIVGCAPTVKVATQEPIVIQLNIQHELRVKIERDVDALVETEGSRGQVVSRGLGEDVSGSLLDAQEVSSAKQAGRLGERADGYLGVVPEAETQALEELAVRVNQERRQSYVDLAASYDTSLETVAAIAGERRLAAAGPGEKVMTADGRWTQKPR
jgi:uncharacterized protein YdbL (DUF1318 family)